MTAWLPLPGQALVSRAHGWVAAARGAGRRGVGGCPDPCVWSEGCVASRCRLGLAVVSGARGRRGCRVRGGRGVGGKGTRAGAADSDCRPGTTGVAWWWPSFLPRSGRAGRAATFGSLPRSTTNPLLLSVHQSSGGPPVVTREVVAAWETRSAGARGMIVLLSEQPAHFGEVE